MPVIVTLDKALKDRKITGKQLAKEVGISQTQMSMLRSGKVRGIRFSTLNRICAILRCKPAEILDYDFAKSDLEMPIDSE